MCLLQTVKTLDYNYFTSCQRSCSTPCTTACQTLPFSHALHVSNRSAAEAAHEESLQPQAVICPE